MSFVGMPAAVMVAIAAVSGAVVLLLYLLKSTPRPQIVSNVDFWLRAAERAQPTWMLSTRIPLIAMLVTLAAALLIVLVAGDPRAEQTLEGTTVVVIDAGHSMEARHEGATRFDRAAELLEEVVDRATLTGRVVVIRAGIRPTILVPLTRSPQALDRSLEEHRLDDGPSDLEGALALADRVALDAGEPRRIIVISDRRPETRTATPIELISVGRAGQNVAIVAFGARRDPIALGELSILCEVAAFTSGPARARLVIEDQDMVIAEEQLELAPGGRITHHARGFSQQESEITARLVDIEIEGSADAHPGDDLAYAVVPALASTRALLVSDGNPYLRAALELDPLIELAQMTPMEFASELESQGSRATWRYHVLILDRVHPSVPVSHAGMLLVDPPLDLPDLRLGQELAGVEVTSVTGNHPVLEAVELETIQFERARVLIADPDDRVILRGGRHALALARESRGSRRLTFGFDLQGSDLVRQEAFPLMIHNAVVWLANLDAPPRSAARPGTPITFAGARAEVELPGGTTIEARAGSFQGSEGAGIYRINERPSAISAVDHAAAVVDAPIQPARRDPFDWPPLTLILALLLLALMATEWVLTHRGVL
jgi:hypothetical protein